MTERLSAHAIGLALSRATEQIQREAGRQFQAAAGVVKSQVIAAYPLGPSASGDHLRDNVNSRKSKGTAVIGGQALGWIVWSGALHVHIYEQGTGDRRDPTRRDRLGRGAWRGRMPGRRVFVPAAMQERAGAVARIAALLGRSTEL